MHNPLKELLNLSLFAIWIQQVNSSCCQGRIYFDALNFFYSSTCYLNKDSFSSIFFVSSSSILVSICLYFMESFTFVSFCLRVDSCSWWDFLIISKLLQNSYSLDNFRLLCQHISFWVFLSKYAHLHMLWIWQETIVCKVLLA